MRLASSVSVANSRSREKERRVRGPLMVTPADQRPARTAQAPPAAAHLQPDPKSARSARDRIRQEAAATPAGVARAAVWMGPGSPARALRRALSGLLPL